MVSAWPPYLPAWILLLYMLLWLSAAVIYQYSDIHRDMK